jgi:hypothetical protein|tara:strand:- start:2308 stop:2781 length:474 start_codon:yes stop_codon:yes gene_type:complete
MTFALNFAALEASLISDALPKHLRGKHNTVVLKKRIATLDVSSSIPVIKSVKAMAYPRSLVNGNNGVAPVSLSQGLRSRTNASLAKANSLSCHVHATPVRMMACESASAIADAALMKFHFENAKPNGDVDGALQDVIQSSLKQNDLCALEGAWEKTE